MRLNFVVLLLAAGASASAHADLLNPGIEDNSSGIFGEIDFWGPSGGWADHASFSRPGNGSLGQNFGFYSVNNDETVGQITDVIFSEGTEYIFGGWGQGGGNDVGTMVYEIGYDDGGGNYVLLNSMTYDVGAEWQMLAGVGYTPSAGDAAIGQNVWVRLGPGGGGDSEDVWFDSFFLVPAPTSGVFLGFGCLVTMRRRR